MRPRRIAGLNRIDVGVYAVAGCLALFQVGFVHRIETYWGDSSYYIGLARSLVERQAYEFNFASHTQYPPGLPVSLALLSLVGGFGYAVFIRAIALSAVLVTVVAYHLLRREEGRAAAAAGFVLLAFSPHLFRLSTRDVGSDIPYFFTSMLTLLLAARLDAATGRATRTVLGAALAVALVGSVMMRSVGITLVGGLGLWLVLSAFHERARVGDRLVRFGPALVAALVVEALWIGWTRAARAGEAASAAGDTYLGHFLLKDAYRPELGAASAGELGPRIAGMLWRHSAHVAELITRIQWIEPNWYSPVVLAPIVLVILGLARSPWRVGFGYPTCYFVLYVAMHLLWPHDEGARYILPVFPLAWLYLWRGGQWLAGRRPVSRRVAVGGLLIALLLGTAATMSLVTSPEPVSKQAVLAVMSWGGLAVVCSALHSARLRQALHRTRLTLMPVAAGAGLGVLVLAGLALQVRVAIENVTPDPTKDIHYPSVDAGTWIKHNTADTETVMAEQPAIVHRITGRRVVSFPVTTNPEVLMGAIRRREVRLLIVTTRGEDAFYSPTEAERFVVLQASCPGCFIRIREGPGYHLYRIATGRASRSPGAFPQARESGGGVADRGAA